MNVTKNTDYKILCVPVSIKYSQFCSFNTQIYWIVTKTMSISIPGYGTETPEHGVTPKKVLKGFTAIIVV